MHFLSFLFFFLSFFFHYFFNSSKWSNLEGANFRSKKISLILQLLLKSAKLSSRKSFRNRPSEKSNLREIYQNQFFEIFTGYIKITNWEIKFHKKLNNFSICGIKLSKKIVSANYQIQYPRKFTFLSYKYLLVIFLNKNKNKIGKLVIWV